MINRRPLIAGNWKLYKTLPESEAAIERLQKLVDSHQDRDIMIAPTYVSLAGAKNKIHLSNLYLGAQNIFWEKEGAFTGEISGEMLKSAGCNYVLIGHSERRQIFGETNVSVNKKIHAALDAGLKPVLCIGETGTQREEDQTDQVIESQISQGLKEIPQRKPEEIVIAYEPVWAIGTGKTAQPDQAQEMHAKIRAIITNLFSTEFADNTRILYGGSVKPANISALMALSDVDGVLVGGASLDPEIFAQIVNFKI